MLYSVEVDRKGYWIKMATRIVTDSTGDLPLGYIQKHDLKVLPFPVHIDGQEYLVGPDEGQKGNISKEDFYALIAAGKTATTAQIPLDMYLGAFEEALQSGDDVLYLCFSGGLTGTMNSARLAAQELAEKYPQRKICLVDTLGASLGEGMVVMETVAKLENEGGTADELADFAQRTAQRVKHWFTVNDLHYLARGGRLSGSAAFVGTLLNVKPVLDISAEGKLVPREKTQGRKKALKAIADKYFAMHGAGEAHIAHAGCPEDAEFVRKYLEGKGVQTGLVEQVTPVIVAHTGLGVLAVFFMSDDERNA